MKNFIFFLVFAVVFKISSAQFNDFKYVVVPVKYDAFKNQNQFKTSTITKYLLVKKGLNVVYSDDLPEDLKKNGCLGLNVDLKDLSTMFTTKAMLVFTDCDGIEVYRTKEGRSKEKNFELSYKQAIEKAIESMEMLNYSYDQEQIGESVIKSTETQSDSVQKDYQKSKGEAVIVNMSNDLKKLRPDEKKEYVIEKEATTDRQIHKAIAIKESNLVKKTVSTPKASEIQMLYAQATDTGYQLVDTTPKVVYNLTSTSLDDTYLVEGIDDGKGLLHKKEGKWLLEYNSKNGKTIRELNIKF